MRLLVERADHLVRAAFGQALRVGLAGRWVEVGFGAELFVGAAFPRGGERGSGARKRAGEAHGDRGERASGISWGGRSCEALMIASLPGRWRVSCRTSSPWRFWLGSVFLACLPFTGGADLLAACVACIASSASRQLLRARERLGRLAAGDGDLGALPHLLAVLAGDDRRDRERPPAEAAVRARGDVGREDRVRALGQAPLRSWLIGASGTVSKRE